MDRAGERIICMCGDPCLSSQLSGSRIKNQIIAKISRSKQAALVGLPNHAGRTPSFWQPQHCLRRFSPAIYSPLPPTHPPAPPTFSTGHKGGHAEIFESVAAIIMATDTMGAASGGASSRRQGLSCPPLPHHRAFYAVALVVFCSLSFTARQTQPLTASDRALGAASSSSVSSSLLLNTLRGATTTRPSTATSPQPTTTYKPLAAANVPVMPPVVVEAKLGDVRGDPSYCRHGGLELDHGRCICGRGTQGLRCEGINASLLAKVQDYGVCGPGACMLVSVHST